MVFVASVGIVGVIATLIVSFIPPDNINVGGIVRYELTLIIGLILMCLPPFICSWLKSKNTALELVT